MDSSLLTATPVVLGLRGGVGSGLLLWPGLVGVLPNTIIELENNNIGQASLTSRNALLYVWLIVNTKQQGAAVNYQ